MLGESMQSAAIRALEAELERMEARVERERADRAKAERPGRDR